MKFAGFIYSTNNIGDEIQSIAAEQFLPNIQKRFDRDKLTLIKDKSTYILIMNGWFSHSPNLSFPPPENIIPVFIGFHIAKEAKEFYTSDKAISYLKSYEPIGCRDQGTVDLLKHSGIDAYFTGCLSLTFPKRKRDQTRSKTFLVDIPYILTRALPEFILEDYEDISHFTNNYGEFKLEIGKHLLEKYKKEASLIITTKIHCALPCLAMGIPVIYFGNPDNYREKILEQVGLSIYPLSPKGYSFLRKLLIKFGLSGISNYILKKHLNRVMKKVEWNKKPPDITPFKKYLVSEINNKIAIIKSDYNVV